ncbi:MAG: PmoA family protein [Nocardioidaceae bacterium]|nr:PmoA family protein [Nocardioidaceae bacterium]
MTAARSDNGQAVPTGVEPPATGLRLVHEDGRSIRATWEGEELFRYVYAPWDPQRESPRPYFHPLRTLGGDLVSLYRPHDHVWHKGIAWSLCNVGNENFWGGTTYTREHGYQQLENDGGMWHQGFDLLEVHDGVLRFDQRLSWITENGAHWIDERRRVGVTTLPDAHAWFLTFETTMRNVRGRTIPIGSPTTEGRENAGYSGLFWRGPRSFSGGRIVTADGGGRDELMGSRHPWMAYAGEHDGHGRGSTLVFRDDPRNFSFPSQWFVRTDMYACLCPAPFFSEEYQLGDGESLTLRYDVCIADGSLDPGACEGLATLVEERDLLSEVAQG